MILSFTYKFAVHNDCRLSFNVSYDRHKFKYLQNCVTMIGDEIACWFHYSSDIPLSRSKQNDTDINPCISFKWKDNDSIKSFGRL